MKFRILTLVTDLVPSEIACLASSPGRMRRTAVWISRDGVIDFFEYDASSIKNPLTHDPDRGKGKCLLEASGSPLEDVVHRQVENCHCLVGDTRIRVNLLQNYGKSSKFASPMRSRCETNLGGYDRCRLALSIKGSTSE
jgi:hypothetical protein